MTNTTNESPQLFAANELMGAALTANMSKTDTLAFASDPKSFIASYLKFDAGDVSISVVENGADTLNLALPYYSALENISTEALKDADIGDVAGGEIIITLGIIGGAVAGGTLGVIVGAGLTVGAGIAIGGAVAGGVAGVGAAVGIGVGVAAGQKAGEGKNLDGSSK